MSLLVFAVVLSVAKKPDAAHATSTARTFHPTPPVGIQGATNARSHVYILGSETGTLYTGVTSDFDTRLTQHRNGIKSGFASKYHCTRVLLHEEFTDIRSAISREKEIKGWARAKKLALIAQTNPDFKDLSAQHHWQMLHPQQAIADQN